jgi:hypothetical protein
MSTPCCSDKMVAYTGIGAGDNTLFTSTEFISIVNQNKHRFVNDENELVPSVDAESFTFSQLQMVAKWVGATIYDRTQLGI